VEGRENEGYVTLSPSPNNYVSPGFIEQPPSKDDGVYEGLQRTGSNNGGVYDVVGLSVSKNESFYDAVAEWTVKNVYFIRTCYILLERPRHSLCKQYPKGINFRN